MREGSHSPTGNVSERIRVALPSIRPRNIYGDLGMSQIGIDKKVASSPNEVAQKDDITQPAFLDTLSQQIEKEARLRAIVKRVQMSKEQAHPQDAN